MGETSAGQAELSVRAETLHIIGPLIYTSLGFYVSDFQIALKIIIIAELFIVMTISPG